MMQTLDMEKVAQERPIDQGRDYLFRKKWCTIICSWWYVVFALCVTVVHTILVSQLIDSTTAWHRILSLVGLVIDGVNPIQTIVEVINAILISLCAINVYALWRIYIDAIRSQKGMLRTLGLKILYYEHLGLLILAVIGFFVTLPAFTEWMEYNRLYDIFLQIIYIVYAVVLLYSLMMTTILNKMIGNLQVLGDSCGPIKAWVVLCCIEIIVDISILIVYIRDKKEIAILDVLNLVSVIILTILLVRYYRAFRRT